VTGRVAMALPSARVMTPPVTVPPASCTSWAARVPAWTAARSASSASEIPAGNPG
jgi:hypothetical protein